MTNRSITGLEAPSRPRSLTIALVPGAMALIGFASLYMVQMPGSLSSMLASMFTF